MRAASVFDFRFKAADAEEGERLATAVGGDMSATEGYIRHDVIGDVQDPGHFAVVTYWHEQAQGEAVLGVYINDDKIERATRLIGESPSGFLGHVR